MVVKYAQYFCFALTLCGMGYSHYCFGVLIIDCGSDLLRWIGISFLSQSADFNGAPPDSFFACTFYCGFIHRIFLCCVDYLLRSTHSMGCVDDGMVFCSLLF